MKHYKNLLCVLLLAIVVGVFVRPECKIMAAANELQLNITKAILLPEKTVKIKVKNNSNIKGITFQSNNEAVATVSQNGIVKGITAGEAMIVVKAGKNTAKVEIVVKDSVVKVNEIRHDEYGGDGKLSAYTLYRYDKAGKLKKRLEYAQYSGMSKPGFYNIYEYDEDGLQHEHRYKGDGTYSHSTEHQYDGERLVKTIHHAVIKDVVYKYDSDGRLKRTIVHNLDGTISNYMDYDYDGYGRLIKEVRHKDKKVIYWATYEYGTEMDYSVKNQYSFYSDIFMNSAKFYNGNYWRIVRKYEKNYQLGEYGIEYETTYKYDESGALKKATTRQKTETKRFGASKYVHTFKKF